jgi:hypothetical protein
MEGRTASKGGCRGPSPEPQAKRSTLFGKVRIHTKGEVLLSKSRGLVGVARRLRRDPSVSLVIWRLKPLQRGPAEAMRTSGISQGPSIVRKAHMGPLVLTVEKLKRSIDVSKEID